MVYWINLHLSNEETYKRSPFKANLECCAPRDDLYLYKSHSKQWEIIQSSGGSRHLFNIPLNNSHLFKIAKSVINFYFKKIFNSAILNRCKFFSKMVDHLSCLPCKPYNFSWTMYVMMPISWKWLGMAKSLRRNQIKLQLEKLWEPEREMA